MEKRVYYDAEDHKVLINVLTDLLPEDGVINIVCVGTDRSTGDAMGPITGSIMKSRVATVKDCRVFGTLEYPVHGDNLDRIQSEIKDDDFTVAVDAGLGEKSSVGALILKDEPLKPGSGVDKEIDPVGDVNIAGIVNVGGYMPYLVLQSTRLSFVQKMARTTANIIMESLYPRIKSPIDPTMTGPEVGFNIHPADGDYTITSGSEGPHGRPLGDT